MYKAVSHRYTYESKDIDNLVLIPTFSDGTDAKKVFPNGSEPLGTLDTLKVLGNARPCPKLCGGIGDGR